MARASREEASGKSDDEVHSGRGSLHRMPGRAPDHSEHPGDDDDSAVFPAQLFEQPNSIFVYGAPRSVVNLTLFALASAANPEFHWVELGLQTGRRELLDPVHLGWIPQNRLWLVGDPDAFRRPPDVALDRLSAMIREDEPAESRAQLTEFLSLPDRSQQIFTHQDPHGRPAVVAVTDVHHLEGELSPQRISSVLSVHLNAGVSVMVGDGETPGPLRDLFGYVFRLQAPGRGSSDWRDYRLVCEKGISAGPLRDFRPLDLAAVPLLRDVFTKAGSVA